MLLDTGAAGCPVTAPQLWRQPGLGGVARCGLLLETALVPVSIDEKLGEDGRSVWQGWASSGLHGSAWAHRHLLT